MQLVDIVILDMITALPCPLGRYVLNDEPLDHDLSLRMRVRVS